MATPTVRLGNAEHTPGVDLLILRALAFLAVAGLALTGAEPAVAATSAPSATDGLAYVALGDSYAAGYGLADPTGKPVAGCSQSALDYPHQVARRLGLRLTDVTCSGATSGNVLDTAQEGAPPQVDALGTKTKVVTVSIGGNDGDLFGSASSCIALSANGPIFGASTTLKSCTQKFVADGHDYINETIDKLTAPDLRKTFAAIGAAAPSARVFVIGYPVIFPDAAHTPAAGCFRPVVDSKTLTSGFPKNGFPFTNADVTYLHGVQKHLDQVQRAAAKHAGFTFVEDQPDSEAHSACATTGAYINGITLTASDGFKTVSMKTGALHPNSRGAGYLADRATAAIAASYAATSAAGVPQAGDGGFTLNLVWIVLAGVLVVFVVILVVAGRGLRRRRDEAGPR